MTQTTVETKEFEEKTVDKAIETACKYFGCTKEDLDVEIITRGSTGLFGLGGKKAKIRATAAPKSDESPKEELLEQKIEGRQQGTREEASVMEGTGSEAQEEAVQESLTPASREETKAQEKISREDIERRLAIACDITNEILEKSGLSGHADVMEQTSRPFVNITGDDLSLIIGKEGQTLDALEYLVNLCLRRRDPDVNYRVMIEAAGYRERRKKSLVSMAERLAIKAKRTGKSVSMHPMPARERRIVHMTLKDFKGVKTHSSGQGPNRKVVITPVRKRRQPKR